MMLIDSAEIYKVEMEDAKRMHPDDIDVYTIGEKVMEAIQKLFERTPKTNPQPQSQGNLNTKKQTEDKSESAEAEKECQMKDGYQAAMPEKEHQAEDNSEDPMAKKNKEDNLNQNEHAEIDPNELDMIELVEYLNSTQGRKDIEEYEEEMSAPSFSLGIDNPVMEICKEINKEHCADAEPDANKFVTPAPEKMEQRTKREAKIGPLYRSPYVRREIDLNEKYSVQDYAVWRWIVQKQKDK